MAWYDKAVFYHIYPLGLCGCKKENNGECENHFDKLNEWTGNIKKLNCTAIYIGPLFESVGHGYETTDYKRVDCRLGTNDDFKKYVDNCHRLGLKVIVDGVFNHVGREFFAFKDLKANRENSRYKDWFCNVNFWNNNEYNDGFSYDNWGGYNLLVKLNQRNPEVKDYIYDVIEFWVKEFDIDGIRLDAADVLDYDFMRGIRSKCDSLKEEFWLMGEVIHGQYSNWANPQMLHSVTNYELHKALYSGHNDYNFFEIAHTVQRSLQINGDIKLYSFVDNHDVARIYSKLNNKGHLFTVHLLLYGLPGIPSIYYGSEFLVEGNKEQGSDASLRPQLNLADFRNYYNENKITKLIMRLGQLKKHYDELSYGRYEQLLLTNRQFAFARVFDNSAVLVVANNDDAPANLSVRLPVNKTKAVDLLEPVFGKKQFSIENGQLNISLDACDGTVIFVADEPENIEFSEDTDLSADNIKGSRECCNEEDGVCPSSGTADSSTNDICQLSGTAAGSTNDTYEPSERLKKQMAFAIELDKEKLIGRQTYIADASRKENDAEHAWHIALMTMLLSEYANEKFDILHTIEMLIIHDVVEIDAGDTFAYDSAGNETKREREVAAADRIFALLPDEQAAKFRTLWDEFEEAATPEAKFANAMDSVQPAMLNDATGGKSWREHGVAAESVLSRLERKVRPGSEELFKLLSSYVERNRKEGNLK